MDDSEPTASTPPSREMHSVDGKVVGWVTSGGYGHTVGKSLALGYVPKDLAASTSAFEIEIIGERRPAKILKEPPYDPSGSRMRV